MEETGLRVSRRRRERVVCGAGIARLAALILLASPASPFELEMPAIFGDGMVLQREVPVAVWGRAAPGQEVRVRLAEDEQLATADADGSWLVRLAPRPAGGPFRLTVEGETTLVFEDVLFGEVWLGVGQSNMGLPVEDCAPLPEDLSMRPRMRLYQEMSLPSSEPGWHGEGGWATCGGEAARVFSGTLFHFGRVLHEEIDVPVGLIQASVGGSRIQAWMDRELQLAHPALAESVRADEREYHAFDLESERRLYRARMRAWKEAGGVAGHGGRRPRNLVEFHVRAGSVGGLFNAKIAPLIPYSLRGVVWYQGESNVYEAELYGVQLPLLVQDWRSRWCAPELPFVWVQLPNFCESGLADWPLVREAMRRSLRIPNTGMAVAIDLGQPRNVHPPGKRPLGRRLADWALGTLYGRACTVSGPLYRSHATAGARVVVRFDHAEGGLVVRGPRLQGFELAGVDGAWYPARGRIEGDTVVLETPRVPAPVELRYAWRANPRTTLYNRAGHPASPFTTEDVGLEGR